MGLIKLKRSDSFVAAQKFFRFLAEFIMWEDLPMVAFDARVVVWVVPVTGNAVVTLMQVSISPHAFSVLGSHFRQVRLRHQPTLFTSCILFGLTFIRRTDVIFIASSFTMGLINSLYFFINTIHIPSGLSDNWCSTRASLQIIIRREEELRLLSWAVICPVFEWWQFSVFGYLSCISSWSVYALKYCVCWHACSSFTGTYACDQLKTADRIRCTNDFLMLIIVNFSESTKLACEDIEMGLSYV